MAKAASENLQSNDNANLGQGKHAVSINTAPKIKININKIDLDEQSPHLNEESPPPKITRKELTRTLSKKSSSDDADLDDVLTEIVFDEAMQAL